MFRGGYKNRVGYSSSFSHRQNSRPLPNSVEYLDWDLKEGVDADDLRNIRSNKALTFIEHKRTPEGTGNALNSCYTSNDENTPVVERATRVLAPKSHRRSFLLFSKGEKREGESKPFVRKASSFRVVMSKMNIFKNTESGSLPRSSKEGGVPAKVEQSAELKNKTLPRNLEKSSAKEEVSNRNGEKGNPQVEGSGPTKWSFWKSRQKPEISPPAKSKTSGSSRGYGKRSNSFQFEMKPSSPVLSVNNDKDRRKTIYVSEDQSVCVEGLCFKNDLYQDSDAPIPLSAFSESPVFSNISRSKLSDFDCSETTASLESDIARSLRTPSYINVLEECEKTMMMFDEDYMSDGELYEKRIKKISFKKINNENRMSVSLSALTTDSVFHEVGVRPSKLPPQLANSLSQLLIKNHSIYLSKPESANDGKATEKWISPKESAAIASERRPPFVLPRPRTRPSGPPPPAPLAPVAPTAPTAPRARSLEQPPESPSFKDRVLVFEEGHFSDGASNELLIQKEQNFELRSHAIAPRGGKVLSLASTLQGAPNLGGLPARLAPKAADLADVVIIHGSVHKTRLIKNGKKVKKDWKQSYAVLTPNLLMFYKDMKTYKAASTAPGNKALQPEQVVPLAGALISKSTEQHTNRAFTNVLSFADHDQLIMQHEEFTHQTNWHHNIIRAIDQLSSGYTCPDNSRALPSTPSPTNRHRTKSSSKAVDSAAEEDADKYKVISLLRKFVVMRPTRESLIKKGIYKDEPVFGRSLEEVCPRTNPRVPQFVQHCVRTIEASEENMTSDGLYRASGNLSQVQKIRLQVNQNNLSVMEKEPDVHVLTGALKLFFRELSEPLIPCSLFKEALDASSNQVSESRIEEFQKLVRKLPECNKQTLIFMLEHLLKVTARKDKNRMHIANLAIVLGPTLLWAPLDSVHNIAIDCFQQNLVIEYFLADFDKIFTTEGRRK